MSDIPQPQISKLRDRCLIAGFGGILLALMELAAVFSLPGTPLASPLDIARLTTWLALGYAAGLGVAGWGGHLAGWFWSKMTKGSESTLAREFGFTWAAAACGTLIWIRTIGRLGSETPVYAALALLTAAIALFAGLGVALLHRRMLSSGRASDLVASLGAAVIFLGVFVGASQGQPGPFGRTLPPSGLAWRLAFAVIAGGAARIIIRWVAASRLARPASWAAMAIVGIVVLSAASDFSDMLSRRPEVAVRRVTPQGAPAALSSPGGDDIRSTPNVILISIDTLRADHLSCYGAPRRTSPAIDRLAAEGIRFEKTASTASSTLPAHASMMTGLFPSSHGATHQDRDSKRSAVRGMTAGYPTMAAILSARGYETAGFVSGPLLSRQFGFSRGFDYYDDRYDRLQTSRSRLFARTVLFRWMRRAGIYTDRDLDTQRTADELNPLLLSWLESRANQARPFFLFAHYRDPHGPYAPPPPLDQREDGSPIRVDYDLDRLLAGQYALTESALDDTLRLYDREIEFVDHHVGELMDYLRASGVLDRSVVILTSDHGESFGEHGHWEHSRVLYEDLLRVPFILRLPEGHLAGTVVADAIAQPTDILPTVLGLVGAPLPQGIEGRDLLGPASGDGLHGRGIAFAEMDRNVDWPARWGARSDRDLAAARTLRWKYILSSAGGEELFDLLADPGELRNILLEQPEAAATLRALLSVWQRSLSSGAEGEGDGNVDERLRDNLRRLDHVQ